MQDVPPEQAPPPIARLERVFLLEEVLHLHSAGVAEQVCRRGIWHRRHQYHREPIKDN